MLDVDEVGEVCQTLLDQDEQLGAQNAIVLSPDGKLLAALTVKTSDSMSSMETKRQVTMFEVASGRKLQTLNLK